MVAIYFALASFDLSIRLLYWLGKYSMTALSPSFPIWFRRTPRLQRVYVIVRVLEWCGNGMTYGYNRCIVAMESDPVSWEGVVELPLQ